MSARSTLARARSRAAISLIALASASAASIVGLPASAVAKARPNVNFVGTWAVSGGAGFTITSENRRTGACSGRSALSKSGYKLVACHVAGNRYGFVITYGPSYRSTNTGVITGNRLAGTFHDTNGTKESYKAVRHHR